MEGNKVAIPAVCFIPRGVAARNPQFYTPDLEEIEEDKAVVKAELARQKLTAGDKAAEKAKNFANELGPEFDMDNYDSEDEDDDRHFFSNLEADMPLVGNDPYLKDGGDDSGSEADNEILPTDLLLVAGTADRDWSTLEVYLWDESPGAFYVHHEVQTGAYPLALEWVNTCKGNDPSVSRNLMAVGSFDSAIEIWDLDVLETPAPIMTLGVSQETQKLLKSKNQKKKAEARELVNNSNGTHTAAVLSLHRNPVHANMLASGSADNTVRVWDLQQGSSQHCYTHHKDKVQAVRWAPAALSPAILATGAYDRTMKILDVRAPEVVTTFKLSGDCEAITWNEHVPNYVLVASEDGKVVCTDVRMVSEKIKEIVPVWTISDSKTCSSIAGCHVPNLWVTSHMDGHARVYHAAHPSNKPTMILDKDLKVGPLFTVRSCNDETATFGFGGEQVALLDLTGIEEIKTAIPGLLTKSA